MPKVKTSSTKVSSKKVRPALTPDGMENQMVSLAVDLAKQQLIDGTASSQVITHYLKLGTEKEKLEREKLRMENNLIQTKIESLESAKRVDELYAEALQAMRSYSGGGKDD